MTFAIYARKSVYSDKSDSVSNQTRMCREYVELKHGKGHSFLEYQDEGFSGATTNRPGLKSLISDIKDGLVDVVVIYQLDRLSRSVRDFSNIYAMLDDRGVKFISIKENVDTETPIGRAMVMITMVFAQMERETISQRVTDNMIGLAKKGYWLGGKTPVGYKRKEIMADGKKHIVLQLDPDKVGYVQYIFDAFLEGGSLAYMETKFRNEGFKSQSGGFLFSTQIHNIVTCPYYAPASKEMWDYFKNKGCQMINDRDSWDGQNGVMVYGRRTNSGRSAKSTPPENWIVCQGFHEPLISAETWIAVQDRLQSNQKFKQSKFDAPLLKGVIRCKNCGRLLAVGRKKTLAGVYSYYFCSTRARMGVDRCDMKSQSCASIDDAAMEIFNEIESDPESVKKYLKEKPSTDPAKEIAKLERESTSIKARIERLTESIASGSAASKYVIMQIEKEDLNLEAINREISILKAEKRRAEKVGNDADEKAAQIRKMMSMDGLSANEKNAVVREVVKDCLWDGTTLFLTL